MYKVIAGAKASRGIKNIILFFLLGFIVFSPLSSEITINRLNLPMALPELLLLPFLYLLRNKFSTIRLYKSFFICSLIVLFFLFVFACFWGRFSISSIVSNARVWLYLFLFYSWFKKPNSITLEDLMFFSLGALWGWAIVCIMNFQLLSVISDDGATAIYGPMLAIPLFLVIVLSTGKSNLLPIGLIALVIILLLSGLRRAMAVTFVTIAVYIALIALSEKKKLKKIAFILLIMIGLSFLLLPIVSDMILEVSPGLHHRVFVRTERLFTEGLSSTDDDVRTKGFMEFFQNIEQYTLPHGFISHQTDKYAGVGVFNDFPLTQLCWMFGWPIAVLLIMFFVHILIVNVKRYVYLRDPNYLLSSVCLVVMFVLLFLEGAFLIFVYATPITGLLLAKASTLKIRRRN